MPFREGCSELLKRFRAWRLCIEQSRNVRASALISTATAASHSTSKGYSVTILSSMGKAAPSDRWHRPQDLFQAIEKDASRSISTLRPAAKVLNLARAGNYCIVRSGMISSKSSAAPPQITV
jgi:hypothetical protein